MLRVLSRLELLNRDIEKGFKGSKPDLVAEIRQLAQQRYAADCAAKGVKAKAVQSGSLYSMTNIYTAAGANAVERPDWWPEDCLNTKIGKPAFASDCLNSTPKPALDKFWVALKSWQKEEMEKAKRAQQQAAAEQATQRHKPLATILGPPTQAGAHSPGQHGGVDGAQGGGAPNNTRSVATTVGRQAAATDAGPSSEASPGAVMGRVAPARAGGARHGGDNDVGAGGSAVGTADGSKLRPHSSRKRPADAASGRPAVSGAKRRKQSSGAVEMHLPQPVKSADKAATKAKQPSGARRAPSVLHDLGQHRVLRGNVRSARSDDFAYNF